MARLKKTTTSGPPFPKIGTVIDEGRLRLVSVIGTGGYGIVYRATETRGRTCQSFAVKCLIQDDEKRPTHLREITLHKVSSSHPGIVTLHRVIEEGPFLYLIMEYAPNEDLFVQILHKCRYLGNEALIRDTFLQLLDAIEHCHFLGIYHRDLKPENVVCFEDGLRLALTDFGLATTEGTSDEFRTGSVYHMSPECQDSDAAYEGIYSPQSCDIWSLGIVLLNIVTGRNPWKSANQEDPTFRAYRRNPCFFLPKILPISSELNDVLVMMLNLEWRARPTIPEIRAAINEIDTFYSTDAVFEGNVARCSWESGMDLGTGTHKPNVRIEIPQRRRGSPTNSQQQLFDVFEQDEDSLEDAFDEDSLFSEGEIFDDSQCASYSPPHTPTSWQSISSSHNSDPSSPITPNNADSSFDRNLPLRPKSSFTSLIGSFQSFLRLCSSSNSLQVDRDRLKSDFGLFTNDT